MNDRAYYQAQGHVNASDIGQIVQDEELKEQI